LKLKLETRTIVDVTVLSCTGRVTYGNEASAFSEKVAELLPYTRQLIVELSGVEMMDSAGLGELVVVLMWAQASGCHIKLAAPQERVQQLLELTNLASVFEIHPRLDEACLAFHGQAA